MDLRLEDGFLLIGSGCYFVSFLHSIRRVADRTLMRSIGRGVGFNRNFDADIDDEVVLVP